MTERQRYLIVTRYPANSSYIPYPAGLCNTRLLRVIMIIVGFVCSANTSMCCGFDGIHDTLYNSSLELSL